MKIVNISDMHNLVYQDYSYFEGADMCIFAGDATNRGSHDEVMKFLAWYSGMPVPIKIMIAGNHDYYFDQNRGGVTRTVFGQVIQDLGIIYLDDELVEVSGMKIWGSPIQPYFHNWAFNRMPGDDIQKHWDLIPDKVDILITHGPPHGILDVSYIGETLGCPQLLRKVMAVNPKLHVFGHIHEGYGTVKLSEILSAVDMMGYENDTIFVNPAVARYDFEGRRYTHLFKPITVEL